MQDSDKSWWMVSQRRVRLPAASASSAELGTACAGLHFRLSNLKETISIEPLNAFCPWIPQTVMRNPSARMVMQIGTFHVSMCRSTSCYMHICMHAFLYLCVYVCMYVCMYRYMNNTAYMSVPLVTNCTTRISTTGSPSGLCKTLVGLHGGLLIQLL